MASFFEIVRDHAFLILLGAIGLAYWFGTFNSSLHIRVRLGLKAWEAGDEEEWIILGVRMYGLSPKDEKQPVAIVRLNVRTGEVRGAPRGYCTIQRGRFYHSQLSDAHNENVCLGAPPYTARDGKVSMCDTLYVRAEE